MTTTNSIKIIQTTSSVSTGGPSKSTKAAYKASKTALITATANDEAATDALAKAHEANNKSSTKTTSKTLRKAQKAATSADKELTAVKAAHKAAKAAYKAHKDVNSDSSPKTSAKTMAVKASDSDSDSKPTCNHVLTSGARKGDTCNKTASKNSEMCSTHTKAAAKRSAKVASDAESSGDEGDSPGCTTVLRGGARKGQACGLKHKRNGMCTKHANAADKAAGARDTTLATTIIDLIGTILTASLLDDIATAAINALAGDDVRNQIASLLPTIKPARKTADPAAPKKEFRSAYDHYGKITRAAAAPAKVTTQVLSAAWKEMDEDDRGPHTAAYAASQVTYLAAMELFQPTVGHSKPSKKNTGPKVYTRGFDIYRSEMTPTIKNSLVNCTKEQLREELTKGWSDIKKDLTNTYHMRAKANKDAVAGKTPSSEIEGSGSDSESIIMKPTAKKGRKKDRKTSRKKTVHVEFLNQMHALGIMEAIQKATPSITDEEMVTECNRIWLAEQVTEASTPAAVWDATADSDSD